MPRIRLSKPSPAMVVAGAALVVAMGGSAYAAGLVRTSDIHNGAVTTDKLHAHAVTSLKIAAGAVGSGRIAKGAVGPAQLANGAVGPAQLANGAVGSTQLANGAVKLANLGVVVNSYYQDAPLPDDGEAHTAFVQCPAGSAIIGGGSGYVRATGSTSVSDLRLVYSRAGNAPNGAFPAQGSGFNGWTVSMINEPGPPNDGTAQVTAMAVCLGDASG